MKNLKRILAGLLVMGMIMSIALINPEEVEAETDGVAILRILSTTDLHGMAGLIDYNTASDNSGGSLAKLSTLMNQSKKLKYGNTLMVDCGDTAYGYLSDKSGNGEIKKGDYMYSTMKYMGYDAITMGNHDFEFGYKFVKEQTKKAGISGNVVLANVSDAQTGKRLFSANKIIEKKMKTNKGKDVTLKIGVIGMTAPDALDTVYSHVGILLRNDILAEAKSQIAAVKKKNPDIIVVLVHAGMGGETYVNYGAQAMYQIAMLPDVDVVCGGHSHQNFPSSDSNVSSYYTLPGVNKAGLINGTAVVQTANAAVAFGQTDLKIRFGKNKVKVIDKKVELKYVDKNTKADPKITKYLKTYDDAVKKFYAKKIVSVDKSVNNYFGMLEDTAVIQMANEAKIQHALEYIGQNPKYSDYKVVAASAYDLIGKNSADDYVNINGKITEKDILNIQRYTNENEYIMDITGKQLREWIEYSAASAYATPSNGGDDIIASSFLHDWSNMKVFDGVEYTIDTTIAPKYNVYGSVINSSSSRLKSLTINGVEVKDDDKILAVLDRNSYSSSHPVLGNIENKYLDKIKIRSTEFLPNYMKSCLNENDEYEMTCDDNWTVLFDKDTTYRVRSSAKSVSLAEQKKWYDSTISVDDTDAYYAARFANDKTDNAGPFVVAGQSKTYKTGKSYDVLVTASDVSGVAELRYLYGKESADSLEWGNATKVENGRFSVLTNGTYSILAQDKKGNRTVKYIKIDNIVPGMVESPILDETTNIKKTVSGKAEPGTTVYVKVNGKEYSQEVAEDGSFKITTGYPYADKKVEAWAVDKNGTKSAKVSTVTLRKAGNQPEDISIDNAKCILTGKVNDTKDCAIVAVDSSNIYYPKDAKIAALKDSTVYSSKKKLVLCDYKESNGKYKLYIPEIKSGVKLEVCTIDWMGRDSLETYCTVENVQPDLPKVWPVFEGETSVYGYVYGNQGDCTVMVVIDGKKYTDVANDEGFFDIEVPELKKDAKVKVKAFDVREGGKTYSNVVTITVGEKKE